MLHQLKYVLLILSLSISVPVWAQASIEQNDTALKVHLSEDVKLTYALKDGLLLGLNQVEIDGVAMSSPDTVQRPVLAQEWGETRWNWNYMQLKEAKVVEGKVMITATLLGSTEESENRNIYVYRGFPDQALKAGLPAELESLRKKTEQIKIKLKPIAEKDAQVQKFLANIKKAEERIAKEKNKGKLKKLERGLKKNKERLENARKAAIRKLINDPSQGDLVKPAIEYKQKLNAYALEKYGDIHRDYYRLPHIRQPAEICTIDWVVARYEESKATLKAGGEIVIVLEPITRNIAGWPYEGWKQHYTFMLPKGQKINVMRQMGTWEIDGHAEGVTLAAMRYRGLGDIEEELSSDGKGGVKNAFSTTETMPGAVGGAPLVSPVVPTSKDVNDRGFALQHRAGAWIVRMARGGGANFVDYQFKPKAIFTSYFEKQGNFKALTEVFPGDKVISQTDEEYFENTNAGKTEPQVYLALVNTKAPFTIDELRNRWQEVDQYVRDIVSEELDFVQFEALPGVGILSDYGWAGFYSGMAKHGLKKWHEQGARIVAYHNPGWPNGRHQGPKGDPRTPEYVGGGVANPYDYVPMSDVEEPWKAMQKVAAELKMPLYVWIGQTHPRNTPLTDRIGVEEMSNWSLNGPNDKFGPGYGFMNLKGNIYSDNFKKGFNGTLEKTFKNFGFQGFWIDSYQNLMMSQLNWAGKDQVGTSMQRGWWENNAMWTRKGVAFMSESHGFPGMSCSIEIHSWEHDHWYMQHVWKWYRGLEMNRFKDNPQQMDDNLFHMMAVKAWTAPDRSYKLDGNLVIPSFKRMANEYMAVLPDMRRSSILPGGKGMLWRPYDSNEEAVLFVFKPVALPAGIEAEYVLEKGKAVKSLKVQHTYRLKGKEILKAFGIREAPLEDPRFGREYTTPAYSWPVK